MGKFYDEIKKDIENVNIAKSSNDFKTLINGALSEIKIRRLFNQINKYYDDNNPNLIRAKLSFDNSIRLQYDLDDAEKIMGDYTNQVITDINSYDKPNLDFLDNKSMEEYVYFTYLYKALSDTVKLYYQDVNVDDKTIQINPKNIILSAKDKIKKEMDKYQFNGVVNKEMDKEYRVIMDFLEKPADFFVPINKNLFHFKDDEEMKAYIKDIDSKVIDNINTIGLRTEENYLNKIEIDDEDLDVDELASSIIKTVHEYIKDRNVFLLYNPNSSNEFPSLGKFLYDIKTKVANHILDDNLELDLGVSKHSSFIKDFLHNPIECMNRYYDQKISYYRLKDLTKQFSMEERDTKVNYQDLINKAQRIKNIITNESDTFNKYQNNNPDLWNNSQNLKSEWFLNYFKNEMNMVIGDALQNNKGGFFENLFGTTSNEYRDFSKRLEEMMDDGPRKGDFGGLRESAQLYLAHKLPSYDIEDEYDENDLNNLDSTSKGRVRLCLAVIDSIDKARSAILNNMDPKEFENNIISNNLLISEISSFNNKIGELDKFQNQIKGDTEPTNENLNKATLDIDVDDLENDMNNSVEI